MKIDKRNIEILDELMVNVLKKKTPSERLAIGFGLYRSAKKQLICYLRSLHTNWDDKKIQDEVIRRISHGNRRNSRVA